MERNELKTSLFGYDKAGVDKYIATMEERLSRRIKERDRRAVKTEEELRRRNVEMKELLRKSTEDCEKLAGGLEEAFATMKRELEAQFSALEKDVLEEKKECPQELWQKLDAHASRIRGTKEYILSRLEEMDAKTRASEKDVEDVGAQTPAIVGRLFRRK